MSQFFHRPHVQNFECSQNVNFTPRLQCAIPSSTIFNFPLSAAAMISLDSRNHSALVVDITERNMDHITSLERSLCSNFFCCGVQLPDLHALLEHFEENHVVVLAPNGKRVYPREGLRAVPLDPASGSSTPTSSRASSVTPVSPSTPQTPLSPSPSSPLSLLPAISPPPNRKSSFTVPHVYTPFTPNLPIDPADPILDSSEIVMSQEPDFDFSVQPAFFPPLTPEITSEFSSSSEDEGSSDSSASSPTHGGSDGANGSDYGKDSFFQTQRPMNVRFIAASAGGKRKTEKSKSGKSRRHHPTGGSHSKRREKMYRCPKNGCVKAYLNPNGLKYHLEKGTCKFVEDEDDAALPKRSRQPSPSTPNCAPVMDHVAYQSPTPLDTIQKIEERSPATAIITDSDPSPASDVPQPLLHSHPASHNNYANNPVPMNSTHFETQHPHPYSYPVELTTRQHLKCEEQEVYSSSPPAPSVLPMPPLPSPPSLLGQSVPQYSAQLLHFHYPVPTYPNGYMHALQQRAYPDLAT